MNIKFKVELTVNARVDRAGSGPDHGHRDPEADDPQEGARWHQSQGCRGQWRSNHHRVRGEHL